MDRSRILDVLKEVGATGQVVSASFLWLGVALCKLSATVEVWSYFWLFSAFPLLLSLRAHCILPIE